MPGTGATFFHAIAYSGSIALLAEVKRLALWAKTDTVEDNAGRTPMFYGAATESEEICKFLFDWGSVITSIQLFVPVLRYVEVLELQRYNLRSHIYR